MNGKNALPPLPWKDSSDWTKVILKTMLRRAADFSSKVHPEGYHGFAMSPGWVQAHRWTGDPGNHALWNHGHLHLYDTIVNKALREAAAEKGLPLEKIPLKQLRDHANHVLSNLYDAPQEVKDMLAGPEGHHAWGIDFDKLDPALLDKIRKEPFNEYKRGGAIPPAATHDIVSRALKLVAQKTKPLYMSSK